MLGAQSALLSRLESDFVANRNKMKATNPLNSTVISRTSGVTAPSYQINSSSTGILTSNRYSNGAQTASQTKPQTTETDILGTYFPSKFRASKKNIKPLCKLEVTESQERSEFNPQIFYNQTKTEPIIELIKSLELNDEKKVDSTEKTQFETEPKGVTIQTQPETTISFSNCGQIVNDENINEFVDDFINDYLNNTLKANNGTNNNNSTKIINSNSTIISPSNVNTSNSSTNFATVNPTLSGNGSKATNSNNVSTNPNSLNTSTASLNFSNVGQASLNNGTKLTNSNSTVMSPSSLSTSATSSNFASVSQASVNNGSKVGNSSSAILSPNSLNSSISSLNFSGVNQTLNNAISNSENVNQNWLVFEFFVCRY